MDNETCWYSTGFLGLGSDYVRNKCPTKALKVGTPHKIWTGKIPAVIYFKIFGKKTFVLDISNDKGKFDSWSSGCVRVRYLSESEACRLWNSVSKKIIVRRGVKFLNEMCYKDQYADIFGNEGEKKYRTYRNTESGQEGESSESSTGTLP